MASFRIHEDQENRRPELQQKEFVKNSSQQTRTVLGVIDNVKKFGTNANLKQVRTRQSFVDTKHKHFNNRVYAQMFFICIYYIIV